MSKFCVLVATLAVLGSATAQYSMYAYIYSASNCVGTFTTLYNYAQDLASIGWNDRVYSVRVRGTWMFYDLVNYNYATDTAMEWVSETSGSICFNFFNVDGISSSARHAGQQTDYRADSITFYEFTYFQAAQEFTQQDKPYLTIDGRISSIIVTGSSDWTIYSNSNYGGQSLCLQLSTSTNPHFVPDTALLNPSFPHGSISSARKGCFSNNVAQLESTSSNTTAHGGSAKRNVSLNL